MIRPGAALLAAALIASSCGGRPHAREVKARLALPPGCAVQVFFATPAVSGRRATRQEMRSVRARLAASSRIRTFAFVPRSLALQRMKLRHAGLSGMLGNPLPASYEIVPRARDDAAALEAEFRHARGVEHVSATGAC